jgi:glycosyltransferase involved in cell wall biosynthesis
MKIVFISNNYDFGGAATGAKLWAESLRRLGHDVTLLSNDELLSTQTYLKSKCTKDFQRIISRFTTFLMYKLSRVHRGNLSIQLIPTSYSKFINGIDADFVFVNWIQNNTISIGDLKRVKSNIILVMHDLWFVTGLAHFPDFLNKKPPSKLFSILEKLDLLRKRRFTKSVYAFLCMSEFSRNFVENVGSQKILVLPYPANSHSFYYDIDERRAFREEFGIPKDKFVFCFGADAPPSDLRKGFDLVKDFFKNLDENISQNSLLILFGNNALSEADFQDLEILNLGVLFDRNRIRAVYSASEVVLVPSRFETFGLVSAEAQLCGAKVVVSDSAAAETIATSDSKIFKNGNHIDFTTKLNELIAETKEGDFERQREKISLESSRIWDSKTLAQKLMDGLI